MQQNQNNKQFEAKAPAYKGDGVAVWVNVNKEGQKYLSIKVLNTINLVAYKYEPKPKPPKVEDI